MDSCPTDLSSCKTDNRWTVAPQTWAAVRLSTDRQQAQKHFSSCKTEPRWTTAPHRLEQLWDWAQQAQTDFSSCKTEHRWTTVLKQNWSAVRLKTGNCPEQTLAALRLATDGQLPHTDWTAVRLSTRWYGQHWQTWATVKQYRWTTALNRLSSWKTNDPEELWTTSQDKQQP